MSHADRSFRALVLDRCDAGVVARQRELRLEDLPDHEVLVEVEHSSVNYKDALAITGRGRIVSGYPIVPGIDLAGTVLESTDPTVDPGDPVIVCGRGIGEEHWGGYSRLARVRAEWLIRTPAGMDSRRAMIAGTAGYTAMLAIMILEQQGLRPGDGDVLVTGASGGVGSFAVAVLSRLGHRVVAATGRPQHAEYLSRLGAAEVIERAGMVDPPARPMLSARWAAAVDSVGGMMLCNVIAGLRRHATVATCGVAGGPDVPTTVYPFILRGVNLMGVDSNFASRERRQAAFDRLASALSEETWEDVLAGQVGLDGVPAACADLLDGRVRGRLLVTVA